MDGYPRNFRFNYPGSYAPGRFMPAASPELGQLISMFSGPVLEHMAGPGSFVPELSPTQMLVDQFAMRNHQNQTRGSIHAMRHDGDNNFADFLLGARATVTGSAPTELNREQAMNMAGMANSPYVKPFLGAMLGPERLEALMHGSKGDVHALSNTLNKINYFREDPSGDGKMNADSLTAFNRGVYSHLYEPQGNIQRLEQHARSSDAPTATAGIEQLKKAARAPQLDVVSDDDVVARMQNMKDAPERVKQLYEKYVAGGTATSTQQQAQELSKFQDAIRSSGVLKEKETTIGGLVERANQASVDDMHGFMAGQVGQITENMFQRGMMPKAVGKMSAADRARLIGATELDDETEIRLSHEMARKDFEDKKNTSDTAQEFRGLTTERERQKFIEENADQYRTQLQDTRETIRQAAKNPMSAESASDLEKLQGFDALASNVDAKRSAEAIKKYTGAVDAIKDIFGDNGNPNAPLPALLAALEGLTGGAIGSMKPEKIQATLRQMQTLAKEAGVGFEQMAAMSAQIDSTGQMLGLTPADTMRIKGGALAAVKVMQDTGSFSDPMYGQVDKGTATQKVSQLITQGAASRGAKSMAALARIYDMSEKDENGESIRFGPDSQLARAVKAYRDNEGDGTYTYVDKKGNTVTRNLLEDIGERGEEGALDIARSSGVTSREYTAQRDNPLVNENANHIFGFRIQKSDEINRINLGSTVGNVVSDLSDTSIMKGRSEDEKSRIGMKLGKAYTKLMYETSVHDSPTQIKKIKEGLESTFQEVFDKEYPNDPARAKQKAQEAAAAMSDSSKIETSLAAANSQFMYVAGRTMREDAQYRGQDRDGLIAAEYSQSERKAQRRMEAGLGHESDVVAKSSDYFRKIGKAGQKFHMDDYLRHISESTTDREILGAYAKDMEAGFEKLGELQQENFVTNADIEKLNDDELKDSARLKKDVKIVSDDVAKKARDEHIAKMGATTPEAKAALAAAYAEHVPGAGKIKPENMTDERQAQMLQELRTTPKFLLAAEKEALGAGQISRAAAQEKAAMIHVGEAKAGREAQAADTEAFHRAMREGHNPELLQAGVHAALRLSDTALTDEQTTQLVAAVKDSSPEGKEKLDALLKTMPISEGAATTFFKPIQSAAEAQIHKTLGVSRITDRELTSALTARATSQDMAAEAAQKNAKEITAEVAKKREEAKKAGKAPTSAAEAQQQDKQHLEEALTKDYVDRLKMSPEEARKKAHGEAESITQSRADAAAKTAGDAKQRADKMEVTAQTVVIKGGRFEGEGGGQKGNESFGGLLAGLVEKLTGTSVKGDGSAAAINVASTAAAKAGGDGASLMDAAVTAIGGSLDTIMKSGAGLDVVGKLATEGVIGGATAAAQKLGFFGLSGKAPPETKPGQEKPDAPLAAQSAAPQPKPAQPAQVHQASGEQLKHDTGNATAAPTPTQPQSAVTASSSTKVDAPHEQSTPAEEKVPLSMDDAVNAAIQNPAGQAVLAGASALYNKYAPDFVKGAVKKAVPRYMEKDERAEYMARKDDSGLAEYAAESKVAPFDELRYEIGALINSRDELTETSDDKGTRTELSQRIQQDTAAKITGSPFEQIMYALSKGEMPQQTFPKGSVAATQRVLTEHSTDTTFERNVTERLVPLPEELKEDVARYFGKKDDKPKRQRRKKKDAAASTDEGTSEPQYNEEQYRLQEVYARAQKQLADPATSSDRREAAQRTIDNSTELMAQHAAAREAGINTDKGVDYSRHLGTINGTRVGNENVERHLKQIKAAAEKDPYAAVSDDVKRKLEDEEQGEHSASEAVRKANEQQLQKAAGVKPNEVKQEIAAPAPGTVQKPTSAGISSANVSPAEAAALSPAGSAQAPVSAAVAAAPLQAAIPETEMTRPDAEPLGRVKAMAADMPYGAAPAAGAASGGGAGGGNMTINGTLTLSGLQEAILNAQGSQVMQTEGGAPVVVDPGMRAQTPAPSKRVI